jgi:hypothetical protein
MALEFISNFNATALTNVIFIIFQVILALSVILFLAWKFVLKPAKYKDIIEVWDTTGSGLIVDNDRGYWKEDIETGSGDYRLLKNKNAKLKHPGIENAVIMRKGGKNKYRLLKFGPGPFDYSVMTPEYENKAKSKIIPLADEDWAKHSLKVASMKKTLKGFLNENKGFIMFTTGAVLGLVLMLSIVGSVNETASHIIDSSSGIVSDCVSECVTTVANNLDCIGNIASSTGEAVSPPPGF